MTRGQDALLMDFAEEERGGPGGGSVERVDASSLKIIHAGAEDLAEHEAYLDALDKAAGKPCVWRAGAATA
jgi:DNA polymerase-3 subunit epsilon